MHKFKSLVCALGITGLLGLCSVSLAADKPGVVIQVSENNPAVWNLALNNARNVQQELGKDKVNVEIVAYGPGIHMLQWESVAASRIKEAAENGVTVSACANTMKAQKLTEKDLESHVKIVKAGVIEIMTRQREGWSYIRP
jgi:uncharacterized protein